MSLVALNPFPLVSLSPPAPATSIDASRLNPSQRLALIGHARIQQSPLAMPAQTQPPVTHSVQTMKSPLIYTQSTAPGADPALAAESTLSSVARRKHRIAHNNPPSYSFQDKSELFKTSSMSSATATSSEVMSPNANSYVPILAPVGIVDMRFLTRQPPHVQKSQPEQPKIVSKDTSESTPPTPPAVIGPTKNRVKASGARAVTGAGKPAPPASDDQSADKEKDKSKKVKPTFLFRPEAQQPTRGPYFRFSPMYHYYHPYRNIHREAIKAEWARLHPVIERPQPVQEEGVATPPRRTSGRQKKPANGRGASNKGKNADKGAKKPESQVNDATTNSPLPTGRRSRATAAAATGAKTKPASKLAPKGKGRLSTGSKRKRADVEEEEKPVEEAVPPAKRPRRGAAAAAAALAAAQEAEETASKEVSPTEAPEETETRVIKRRMRPNARKTAAARAAAMVAKKQKKKSVEDGEVSGEGVEEDGADSVRDDQIDQKNGDETVTRESVQDAEVGLDPEHEREPEIKPRSTRGRGINGRGAGRGKSKRGSGQKRSIITRGTPRQDDATPLPESLELAETDALTGDATQTPAETAEEVKIPPKPKRAYSSKKLGIKSNLEPRSDHPSAEEQTASQENLLPNGTIPNDAKPVEVKEVDILPELD